MRIGFAYNQRPDDVIAEIDNGVRTTFEPLTDDFVEWDDAETIEAVGYALSVFGDVVMLEAKDDFPMRLQDARVDFLFNMAEGRSGPNREAHVPAIAEFFGIPYLGSDPLTLTLALHKVRAKEAFRQRGIATAPFVAIESHADLWALTNGHPYPSFLKPVWEGSSKGIAEANYVKTAAEAVDRARELLQLYRQPILAEAFLPGEEFTVAVLGNGSETQALPIVRYRFTELPEGALPIMGYEAKWVWDTPEAELDLLECPAEVPDEVAAGVRDTAIAAYRALGCRDWSRVDLRLDAHGTPHVIEVNPLPGIIPDPIANSCFPRAAAAAGMTYDDLIQTATRIAWQRITGQDLPTRPRVGAVS
jgi:D-alanine-D-alanine ligase